MKKLLVLFTTTLFFFGFLFADKTITLHPGWNVVSTPKILSDINFSNDGNNIVFYTLSGLVREQISPNTQTLKPLEGFLVNNSSSNEVELTLSYETELNAMNMLFSKNLNIGRNLLGITTLNSPFFNIGPNATMAVDFTNGSNSNKVASSYDRNSTSVDIDFPKLGKSYGVFVNSSNQIYGGAQNNSDEDNNEPFLSGEPRYIFLNYDFNGPFYGNTEFNTLTSIELFAGNEDIYLDKFTFFSSDANLYPAFSKIILSRNDGNRSIIAIKNVNNNQIIFDNLQLFIEQGKSETFTLEGTTNKIGKNEIGIVTGYIQPSITGISIKTSNTNETFTITGETTAPNKYQVYANQVGTEHNHYSNGPDRPYYLENGENILGISTIYSDNYGNTNSNTGKPLKSKINEIKIELDKGASTNVNNITIEKYGGEDVAVTGTTEGRFVVFDLSVWEVDNLIQTGETFIFKANVLKSNDLNDFDFINIQYKSITFSTDDSQITQTKENKKYTHEIYPSQMFYLSDNDQGSCYSSKNKIACERYGENYGWTCPSECVQEGAQPAFSCYNYCSSENNPYDDHDTCMYLCTNPNSILIKQVEQFPGYSYFLYTNTIPQEIITYKIITTKDAKISSMLLELSTINGNMFLPITMELYNSKTDYLTTGNLITDTNGDFFGMLFDFKNNSLIINSGETVEISLITTTQSGHVGNFSVNPMDNYITELMGYSGFYYGISGVFIDTQEPIKTSLLWGHSSYKFSDINPHVSLASGFIPTNTKVYEFDIYNHGITPGKIRDLEFISHGFKDVYLWELKKSSNSGEIIASGDHINWPSFSIGTNLSVDPGDKETLTLEIYSNNSTGDSIMIKLNNLEFSYNQNGLYDNIYSRQYANIGFPMPAVNYIYGE